MCLNKYISKVASYVQGKSHVGTWAYGERKKLRGPNNKEITRIFRQSKYTHQRLDKFLNVYKKFALKFEKFTKIFKNKI